MTRPAVRPADQVVETWEMTCPGAVWVWIYDRRNDDYKQQEVGQRSGTKNLHITRDDRKYNQELVIDENRHLDPFTNGTLRLLGGANRDDSLDGRLRGVAKPDADLDVSNHRTDAELTEMFEVRDPALFAESMDAVSSEVLLRRLRILAEEKASVIQTTVLTDLIAARYPVGGTQRTIREMQEAGERIGATRI